MSSDKVQGEDPRLHGLVRSERRRLARGKAPADVKFTTRKRKSEALELALGRKFLISSNLQGRLGPWDPRPTSGGRNAEWKKLHAESMVEADRLRREGGRPDPRFIYDENFRIVGIEYAR